MDIDTYVSRYLGLIVLRLFDERACFVFSYGYCTSYSLQLESSLLEKTGDWKETLDNQLNLAVESQIGIPRVGSLAYDKTPVGVDTISWIMGLMILH